MKCLRACLLCGSLAAASPAFAVTCNVQSNGVAFGAYDTLGLAPLDGVGNIHISCDAATSFTIGLGSGSGSYQQRSMTGGPSRLQYNLYRDSSRLSAWGEGLGNDVSATGINVDSTVYGRIPARQNVTAGVYVDTIAVTISY